MTQQIYLDYNATAPLRPEVFDVMKKVLAMPLNASSVHNYGREGRKLIEQARTQVADLVNTQPPQIIFNSGATEGNNTVLQFFKNERILVSSIEHPSVLEAASNAERIPVTSDGIVDLDVLEKLLKEKKTALVSVMLVNNETGIIQSVEKISALAKNNGAFFHCDAVQAAGRITINMQEMGIDFLTLSAHKIGGPQGVGALALGMCGITPVLLHGGGQEKKARAGTENIAGITGFGMASELAKDKKDFSALRNKLEEFLSSNSAKIYGQKSQRASNTVFFSIPGIKSETALMALDLDGIAISNGSACSSGTVKSSSILKAMGARNDEAAGGLRVSMGWDTKPDDIDYFIQSFSKFLERLNKRKVNA